MKPVNPPAVAQSRRSASIASWQPGVVFAEAPAEHISAPLSFLILHIIYILEAYSRVIVAVDANIKGVPWNSRCEGWLI